MIVECPKCHSRYDDAEFLTFCPHNCLAPHHILQQRDAAIKLLGQTVRFCGSDESMPTYRVIACHGDGMVSLNNLPGEFAPHLFRIVK